MATLAVFAVRTVLAVLYVLTELAAFDVLYVLAVLALFALFAVLAVLAAVDVFFVITHLIDFPFLEQGRSNQSSLISNFDQIPIQTSTEYRKQSVYFSTK